MFDFIIIGSGIIGMSIARALCATRPASRILIIDKEAEIGEHASGRNSGVLHGGFYYTANSLKALFTVEGNRAMKVFCREHGLLLNECGKLVVAANEQERQQLFELERRGKRNGANVRLIGSDEAKEMEPGVITYKQALYSPETASLNPLDLLVALKQDLLKAGVEFCFKARYLGHKGRVVRTTSGDFEGGRVVNCAGLYADKVAQDYGFGKKYTMIPFKGLYLKYNRDKSDVRMNIYPVPNLKNPFLGVHYTKTADGSIKIGPTAIPAFWRENYNFHERFKFMELIESVGYEAKLFMTNAFGFRDLAFEEMAKYNREYFISLASKMVPLNAKGFGEFTRPGIRAQLLDKTTSLLVQDFIVEADAESVHVLNAVSPAFTCAFPFARFVCDKFIFA
jgi:L-2-hydroxyglutarate oxidase